MVADDEQKEGDEVIRLLFCQVKDPTFVDRHLISSFITRLHVHNINAERKGTVNTVSLRLVPR